MYSVKKVKTFRGMEGHGYNADLYRDGKKIAFVMEEGCGGEPTFEWEDHSKPQVDINIIGHNDQPITYQGTPEEKLFVELANSQSYTFFGHTGRKNGAILMDDILENFKLKKTCKTKTAFRLTTDGEDSYHVIKESFSPDLRAWLVQEHGADLIEIINERPEMQD